MIPTMVGSIPIEFESLRTHPECSRSECLSAGASGRRLGIEGSEGQIMLGFVCQYDQEMVANFYNFEMENVGWKRVACIKAFESTLVFQKPKKICIISIRSLSSKYKNNYSCLVHICTSNKD